MATKGKRHTHKYYKAKSNYQRIWACALPDCNHHMPPHYETLVHGKATICWKCDGPMVLDAEALAMDKPICPDCRGENDIAAYLSERGVINPISGR